MVGIYTLGVGLLAPPIKSNADGVFVGIYSGAFCSSPLFGALKPPKSPKALGYYGGTIPPGGLIYEFEPASPYAYGF